MKGALARVHILLPALWLGLMLGVALIATPAGFALLPKNLAGALAANILAQEAKLSLAFGVLMLLLQRGQLRGAEGSGVPSRFTPTMLLAMGAVFCTVLGYFALQAPMAQAKAGQGALSFAQLHAISMVLFGLKLVLVAAMAWQGAAPRPDLAAHATSRSPSS